jgi:hypothetical protein
MRALDQLKKAVSMTATRKVVDMPDGSEFEFYCTPLTLAERNRAKKNARSDDTIDNALQLLVAKATDEGGVKLFHQGDIPELRNALPVSVVEALMLAVVENAEPEEDEELDMKSDQKAAKGRRVSDS